MALAGGNLAPSESSPLRTMDFVTDSAGSLLPSVNARLPDSKPDIVLVPAYFDPVTHNEDYSFRRLPIAVDALRACDCLVGLEAETEMLLSRPRT